MDKILRRKKTISFKSVHLISSDIYMTKIPSCYGIPGGTLFVITIGTSFLLFVTYFYHLLLRPKTDTCVSTNPTDPTF